MLRILETKGHVRHVADGTRYVYLPTVARERAGRPALAGVLETFFDGSTEKAVAALLDLSPGKLSDEELDRLSHLIDQARLEGR
jgi:predicted transcriptional regulator